MRMVKGGVAHVASVIENDLIDRETNLYKSHVSGLSDLVASALSTRSANTAEWNAVLPRKKCSEKSKERYISRILSNRLICHIKVMQGFISELLEMYGEQKQTVIFMLDQSKICDGFECLMLSLRLSERAIPVAWRVISTKGAIGFNIQKIATALIKNDIYSIYTNNRMVMVRSSAVLQLKEIKKNYNPILHLLDPSVFEMYEKSYHPT